jgi:hypothetical protein
MTNQKRGRDVLPIPDRAYTGLIKYDAKAPEAVFPKMEQFARWRDASFYRGP